MAVMYEQARSEIHELTDDQLAAEIDRAQGQYDQAATLLVAIQHDPDRFMYAEREISDRIYRHSTRLKELRTEQTRRALRAGMPA